MGYRYGYEVFAVEFESGFEDYPLDITIQPLERDIRVEMWKVVIWSLGEEQVSTYRFNPIPMASLATR